MRRENAPDGVEPCGWDSCRRNIRQSNRPAWTYHSITTPPPLPSFHEARHAKHGTSFGTHSPPCLARYRVHCSARSKVGIIAVGLSNTPHFSPRRNILKPVTPKLQPHSFVTCLCYIGFCHFTSKIKSPDNASQALAYSINQYLTGLIEHSSLFHKPFPSKTYPRT